MSLSTGLGSAAGLRIRLIVLLVLLVNGTVLGMGGYAVGIFEIAVTPELHKRTRLIGTIVRAQMQSALELGIELNAIAGLDRYLSDTLGQFDEVDAIIVRDAAGVEVAKADRSTGGREPGAGSARRDATTLPVLDGNRLVGEIQIEISHGFVRTRLQEVLLDVMAIALVAALVALELVLAVAAASVSRPLNRVLRLLDEQVAGNFLHRIPRGGLGGLARSAERLSDHAVDLAERARALPAAVRDSALAQVAARVAEGRPALLRMSDVDDIRIALFLFATGTGMAVSFLPIFAGTLDRPDWLTAGFAAAAPLMGYLLVVVLLTSFGARLASRFGPRFLFLGATLPAALGLVAMGYSTHLVEVTLWRGVVGGAFAIATIACQEYAMRSSADKGSARPIGIYNTVLYSGMLCGAALGGVVAGRFSFSVAFDCAAVTALLAGALGAAMMRGPAGDPVRCLADSGAVPVSGGLQARSVALVLGLMVPLGAATAVVIWYLTPLTLSADGSGTAEVARVVMLYYLCTVLLGPTVSALADGRVGSKALVVAGAAVSLAALLSVALWSGFWPTVIMIIGLGIGHTLMRAPLFALAHDMGPVGASVDRLRLADRLGALAGLGIGAMAFPRVGGQQVTLALGLLATLGLVAFITLDRMPQTGIAKGGSA